MSHDIFGCGTPRHPQTHTITAERNGANGSTNRADRRRLRNAGDAARHFQVTPTTIENWLHRGYIRAFRVEGTRALQYDLDEIERAFNLHGPGKMRDGRKRGKGRVVPLAVVTDGSDR